MENKAIVTAIVDALATTVILLATRFLSPGDAELAKALIVCWQGAAVPLILYFAAKDYTDSKERMFMAELSLRAQVSKLGK